MKSKALHLQEERSKLIKLVKKDNKYIDTDKEQVIMKARIEDIEQEIGEENAKHNFDKIKSLEVLGGESDCINTNGMWSIKKKIFPKIKPQVSTGKRNPSGKMVTNPSELKKVYLEEYLGRLRNRPMHPDMIEIKKYGRKSFFFEN